MHSNVKYIGINQRVPFEVLDEAVQTYLESGDISKEAILRNMLEYTTGLNRANKASNYVVQIISRQEDILSRFKTALKDSDYSTLRIDERKALCLCLICLTYPITYDLLTALAQGFKVQDQINKKFISEKVMALYGSNRTVDVAIDALLPMIIELNTIKRDKVSLYSMGKGCKVSNKFIDEMIIYTDIKLSRSKSILIDDLTHRPWYSYFKTVISNPGQFNKLIVRKESAVGKGYLTLKQLTMKIN